MNSPKTAATGSTNPAFLPLSIARMLWKRKIAIVIIWILLSGGTVLVVRSLPPVYKSEALILVDSQKIPEKFVAATVSTDLQDRIATISQQILSTAQLKKIINDFDLYHNERATQFEEEILDRMRKDITVKLERGWSENRPGAFRVGYQGPNPSVVAQVANRLANLYVEENLKAREVQAEGTADFIDNQLQEAKKNLDDMESAVSKFKLKYNGELPEQQSALAGTLARLQVQLEANRDATNRAQERKLMLENSLSSEQATAGFLNQALSSPPAAPASPSQPTPFTAASIGPKSPSRLEALRTQLGQLRARYTDSYPEVRRLEMEIAQQQLLDHQAAESASNASTADGNMSSGSKTVPSSTTQPVKTASATAPDQGNPGTAPKQQKTVVVVNGSNLLASRERLNNLESQIKQTDGELQFRKAEQERILQDIATYQGRLEKLPIREQEMAQITRDYEISKANYKSLLDKKFSAEMATDMERRQKSERFTILDAAPVPEKPAKPNRPLLMGIGSALSLLIGLACGLGVEFRRQPLLGEWELPPGVPILARLPFVEIRGEATDGGRRQFGRGLRIALWSSAALSVVALIGAAAYYFVIVRGI